MTVSGSGTKERTEDMLALVVLVLVCKQESEVATGQGIKDVNEYGK